MDHDENSPFSRDDDEKKRRDLDKFLNKYWSLRAEMARLEEDSKVYYARQTQFLRRFMSELKQLVINYYPEDEIKFLDVESDLKQFAILIYDEVVKLCYHYIEEKPGYYSGLYEVKFEIITTVDQIQQFSHAPKFPEMLKVANNKFEEEYVKEFWRGSYEKHIHLLLKRILPDYINEIYQLPAKGFRELEGYLFITMLEILEIIIEGPELDKS